VKEVPTIPTPLLLSYRKHKRLLQLFFSFRIKTLSIEFISAAKDLEKKKKKKLTQTKEAQMLSEATPTI
jgi:hypothetical protein